MGDLKIVCARQMRNLETQKPEPNCWNRTTMLLYSELRFAILSIHISTHFSQAFNNMKQVLFFLFFFFDEWFRNEECRDPHPGRLYWARWHPRQKLKRKLMVGFLISLAIALTTCAFGLGVSCGKHWCSRGWGETRAIKLLMRDETVQWQPNWCCRTARSWRNTSVAEKVLPHHSFAIEHNNHDDLENRHWKGRS